MQRRKEKKAIIRQIKQERRRERRRGSILLIVVLSLPMMFGFCALAVDYGILNADTNRLQRGCDAAALAGASKLKQTNDQADVASATTEAIQVAARNGVTLASSDITFPNASSSRSDWSRISVQGRFTRPLLFARFWQMNNSLLNRHATAEVTPVTGIPNSFVPLVITTTDYNSHLTGNNLPVSLIRMQSKTDFATGTVIGISTNTSNNGKSPSQWQDDVQNGTTFTVNINDNDVAINAALQNQSGNVDAALATRVSDAKTAGWNPGVNPTTQDESADYPNYPGSAARRIFTIGVADPTAASTGNQNIVLLKFVRVYLVSSGNGQMTFRLMPTATTNSEGGFTTGGNVSTGLSIVRLIDDL